MNPRRNGAAHSLPPVARNATGGGAGPCFLSARDLLSFCSPELSIEHCGIDLDCFATWIDVSYLPRICGLLIDIPESAPANDHDYIQQRHMVCIGRSPSLWINAEQRGVLCSALKKERFTHIPSSQYVVVQRNHSIPSNSFVELLHRCHIQKVYILFYGSKMSNIDEILQILSAALFPNTEVYIDLAVTLKVKRKDDDTVLIPLLSHAAWRQHWANLSERQNGASYPLFGIESYGSASVYLDPLSAFPNFRNFSDDGRKIVKLKIYNGYIHDLKKHYAYTALSKNEWSNPIEVRKTANGLLNIFTYLLELPNMERNVPAIGNTRFEFTFRLLPTRNASLQACVNGLVNKISNSFKDTLLCSSIVGRCADVRDEVFFKFLPLSTWAAAVREWRRLLGFGG